jgi:hypothetical protein
MNINTLGNTLSSNEAAASSAASRNYPIRLPTSCFSSASPMPVPQHAHVASASSMESPPIGTTPKNAFSPATSTLTEGVAGAKCEEAGITSEQQRQKTLKAGQYCLSFYRDNYKGETLSKHLDSATALKAQFPQLSDKTANDMQVLMEKTNMRLCVDNDIGGLVLVARGSASKGDVIQNAITGVGGEGFKYSNLEKLVTLMKQENITPNTFTGHSLGGGMAMAASKGFADKNSETIVFDAQALNHKQSRKFDELGGAEAAQLNIKNFRIKSPLSLGAIMKVPPLFVKPEETIRLDKDQKKHCPVKELLENHGLTTIMDEIQKAPLTNQTA